MADVYGGSAGYRVQARATVGQKSIGDENDTSMLPDYPRFDNRRLRHSTVASVRNCSWILLMSALPTQARNRSETNLSPPLKQK